MLSHIYLKDFAIIDQLSLDLNSGMTALTGETGAGKSILIDAIGLVLGDRAESGMVKHGKEKAEITLSVDVEFNKKAQQWLKFHDLGAAESECILRRVINANGKSRAWINGSPCNLKMMRQLGEFLVDIHGQHEHQSLMNTSTQRELLDNFANNQDLLDRVSQHYQKWKTINGKIELLNNQHSDHQARLDLLRFQTQELDDFALEENEAILLDDEHKRLSNAENLQQISNLSANQLYEADENSAYALTNEIVGALESGKELDPLLKEPLDLVRNAQILIQESAELLRRYAENIKHDPERLVWVNNRLTNLHDLSRKHKTTPDALFQKWQSLHTELSTLKSDSFNIEALEEKRELTKTAYNKNSKKLSQSRLKSAKLLSKEISLSMQTLGMDGGDFKIICTPNDIFTKNGSDTIEFKVSTNPGQPAKLLNKVASGGELSRISLAIQMIAAQKMHLPALIFDEVDSGIGGNIAEIVGQKLRELGKERQVLCVTHLPQVAAYAHNHFKVTKTKNMKTTKTGLNSLNENERVKEIARMMGGVKITQSTKNLAQEMLIH